MTETKQPYQSKAVCGECGTTYADPDNGYCINGHDQWVELRDFSNPTLENWIQKCANNLDMTWPQLKRKVEHAQQS